MMNAQGYLEPVDSDGTLTAPAHMATGVAEYEGITYVVLRMLMKDHRFELRLTVEQARDLAAGLSEAATELGTV